MSSSEVLSAKEIINKIPETFQSNTNESHQLETEHINTWNEFPSWLTKEYFENCLRTYYKDAKLVIVKIYARPALGKGENFGGVLTRVKVDYKTSTNNEKQGHYIIKTNFVADELAIKTLEPYDLFNEEMAVYGKVLPKLRKLLKEIGDDDQLFADTMQVDAEHSALIFEDLSVRDFIMPDRIAGLDMDLIKIILRKLAKMHATTAVLNEREKGSLESFTRGMFNRHTENNAPIFLGFLEALCECVSKWENYEVIYKKLKNLHPCYMELGKRVFDPTKGHLNVLAHGDLWTNNVMVKYDKKTGKPLDVILIDFQYVAWGSPAIDLNYLFNTSLKEELHLNKINELVQIYHGTLTNTLRKLSFQSEIPSLHKFHLQLQEKAFYAFNSACIVQPIQRNTVTDDADFNALVSNDERGRNFKRTCLKNPSVIRVIKQLLPVYEKMGLLDADQ